MTRRPPAEDGTPEGRARAREGHAEAGGPRRRLPGLPWLRVGKGALPRASGHAERPERDALLAYVDRLEEWSHRAWTAAGVRRPWLPDVVRHELEHQWWTVVPAPSEEDLRARVALFWERVVPWLAWHPEAEPLPEPPGDRRLRRSIVERLEREIERSGEPVVGRERSEALRAAVRRLRADSETASLPARR